VELEVVVVAAAVVAVMVVGRQVGEPAQRRLWVWQQYGWIAVVVLRLVAD
jgi:hypothetical protein